MVPGLSDTILWLMLSAIVIELIVILGLLRILRSLTGIPMLREGWILSFMMIALVGYLWLFLVSHAAEIKPKTPAPAEAADHNHVFP